MKNKVKYNIPTNVAAITDEMIYPFKKLKKISIPNSVRTIYKAAFANKKTLDKVYFQSNSNIFNIPESCFSGCVNLNEINLPESLVSIHKNAFKGCINIKELYLPKKLVYVDPDAFNGWNEDQSIYTYLDLKKPLTNKANMVFLKNNESIEEITLDRKAGIKYYLVTAKCGHVGRDKYMPIVFPVKSKSKKEASDKTRNFPRVKRDHKDFILKIEQVSRGKFDEQITINNNDLYLKIKRKSDQNKIIDKIKNRLVDEPNYKRKNR